MIEIIKTLSNAFGVYVFCAKLGSTVREDREAGFFGDANAHVCAPCLTVLGGCLSRFVVG